MATAVIGALRVDLDLGTSGWTAGLTKAQRDAKGLGKTFQSIGAGIATAGAAMTAGITLPFAALVKSAIPAAVESKQALGQVEAALKSMGGASGLTSEQLQKAAGALQDISNFDDDDILRQVTANMLTFGNVTGDTLLRAQGAVVDLAARLKTDLQSATIMVGKALNNPTKGLAALRRVGIQFTADQEKQIKAMQEAGNTAGAQAIMLKELERQFGGSAKAMREATPDAAMQQQWRTFQETVGGFALKVLPIVTDLLAGLLEKFNELNPAMQETVIIGAAVAAALGPLVTVFGGLVAGIGALIPVVVGWATSLSAAAVAAGGLLPLLAPLLPIIAGVAVAAAAAYLVWKNWATIGPKLQDFAAAVWDAVGPGVVNLLSAVKEAAVALWQGPFGQLLRGATDLVVNFAVVVAKSLGAAIPGVIEALGAIFRAVFDMIAEAIRFVVRLLQGDWEGAWTAAKNFAAAFWRGFEGLLVGAVRAIIGLLGELLRQIDYYMGGQLTAVWNKAAAGIQWIGEKFKWLYDVVVGHSYIPDMVNGIAATMARLDAVMVKPAEKAATKTAQAFRELVDEVQPLLDRLFPEARAALQLKGDLALIDRAQAGKILTPEQAEEARYRLYTEGMERDTIEDVVGAEAPELLGDTQDGLDALIKTLPRLGESARQQTARVITAFAEMSQQVLGTMRSMVDAFKQGDILGGLSQVLDLVLNIVNMGTGGGSSGFSLDNILKGFGGGSGWSMSYGGPRAFGGPVVPGKSYRVGERGAEWFTPAARGRITPDNDRARGNTYYISGNLLTPEFWKEIQSISDGAATRGTLGGAALAGEKFRQQRERALP